MTTYKCSYCGDFDSIDGNGYKENTAIRLEAKNRDSDPLPDGREEMSLDVCIWCFKKVFDTVLGKPVEEVE